jgi:hypothetical protein
MPLLPWIHAQPETRFFVVRSVPVPCDLSGGGAPRGLPVVSSGSSTDLLPAPVDGRNASVQTAAVASRGGARNRSEDVPIKCDGRRK